MNEFSFCNCHFHHRPRPFFSPRADFFQDRIIEQLLFRDLLAIRMQALFSSFIRGFNSFRPERPAFTNFQREIPKTQPRRPAQAAAPAPDTKLQKLQRELGPFSNKKELEKAYKKWALLNHPDKVPPSQREAAKEKFQEITELKNDLVKKLA